ncbi:vacuolar protein sorting-associated protein 26-domain-containing protein [Paraphysoderma sedebokerense]|nr:vacuolar protein sorting-associated protein 26-domain-containing protein [Paraphysoderma sedebokerense]
MNVSALFGLGPSADIDVQLTGEDTRKQVEVKVDKDKKRKFPLYFDGESVGGKVFIRVKDGKRLEHNGIKVEFVGHIEMYQDRGNHYEFASLQQELAVPGEMRGMQTYDFEFKNVEKQYESYWGTNVKLRYFIRVTIVRKLADIKKEKDIWVNSYKLPPDQNHPIKMEVGIEDCLHIEFEYNKSRYHLRDVIVGKIYFLLVRIKIKYMELSIIRREITGAVPNQYIDNETVTKFEIMDGAPVKGETIPIRLFLSGFELTPTFREVNKKFSIKYFLNLVLVDEENRRYFKQQEITMFRKPAEEDSANLANAQTTTPPATPALASPTLHSSSLNNSSTNLNNTTSIATSQQVVSETKAEPEPAKPEPKEEKNIVSNEASVESGTVDASVNVDGESGKNIASEGVKESVLAAEET